MHRFLPPALLLLACRTGAEVQLAPGPALPAPPGDPPQVHRRAVRMGTEVELLLLSADEPAAERAIDLALAEITRVEALMSDWREDSPLMAINHAAGRAPAAAPRELLELLLLARNISEKTGGAFDVTYAAAGRLWDFHADPPVLPAPEEVQEAVARVDYRKLAVDLDLGTAFLPEEGMRVGLGGIAKGYAVERAAAILRAAGFSAFAIKAGGDMRVEGRYAGEPWRIGIRDPRDRERVLAVLPVSNVAISTSGDYERYFEIDGRRYAHILDPRTGYPVEHTRSVTIVAPDCTISDGLSTGVFVLGAEAGMKLVESIEGIQAVIVDATGAIHVSRGLR